MLNFHKIDISMLSALRAGQDRTITKTKVQRNTTKQEKKRYSRLENSKSKYICVHWECSRHPGLKQDHQGHEQIHL